MTHGYQEPDPPSAPPPTWQRLVRDALAVLFMVVLLLSAFVIGATHERQIANRDAEAFTRNEQRNIATVRSMLDAEAKLKAQVVILASERDGWRAAKENIDNRYHCYPKREEETKR